MKITRFPPEPNGYLHIGHLKAMLKDFDSDNCILRLDDTNPESEKQEYVDAIIKDVEWLGFKYSTVTYTSNYFNLLYNCAIKLIERDLAYVDSTPHELIKKQRHELIPSPDRNRPINESLQIFKEMNQGFHAESAYVLRLKIDYQHQNAAMRDPIAYRIKFTPHYRTNTEWKIYPSYDYSHGIIDTIEGITHSYCTNEFYIRREQYYWTVDKLLDLLDTQRPDEAGGTKPIVEEFDRLNIEDVLLSKRKILELVKAGKVTGFDDPSLFTIAGLRNRGYPAEALVSFCKNYVTYSYGEGGTGTVPKHKFEWAVREYMNMNCVRRFAVKNPLMVKITGSIGVDKILRPDDGNCNTTTGRMIPLTDTLYIDRSDFKLDPEKKYTRLAPGREIRFKYFAVAKYVSHDTDSDGNVSCVYVEILDTNKTKSAAINWVSDADKIEMKLAHSSDILLCENNLKIKDLVQFERLGYYRVISENIVIEVSDLKNNYNTI